MPTCFVKLTLAFLLVSGGLHAQSTDVWFFPQFIPEPDQGTVFVSRLASIGQPVPGCTHLVIDPDRVLPTDISPKLGDWKSVEVLEFRLAFQLWTDDCDRVLKGTVYPPSLRILRLVVWDRLPKEFWNALAAMKQIEVLELTGKVDPADATVLSQLTSLRFLSLRCGGVGLNPWADTVDGTNGMVGCDALLNIVGEIRSLEAVELNLYHLPADGFGAVARLPKLWALKSSRLSVEVLSLLPRYANHLRFLDLSGSDTSVGQATITDLALPFLARMAALESLSLAKCPQIGDLGLDYIENLPNLKRLSLTGSRQFRDDPERYPIHMPQLRRDSFDYQDYRISTVANLAKLKKLTHLCLAAIPTLDDEQMELLRKSLPDLLCLDIRNCRKLTRKGLLACGDFKKLKEIYIGENRALDYPDVPMEYDVDDKALGALLALPDLEVFSAAIWGRIDVTKMPSLPKGGFPRLRTLQLDAWEISDDELSIIVESAPNLEKCSLAITKCGPLTVGALRELAKLSDLDLSDCSNITAVVVLDLATARRLRTLNIRTAKWADAEFLKSLAASGSPPVTLVLSRDLNIGDAATKYVEKTRKRIVFD